DKSVLATKPGVVVVSRRLYRSGQSEYLINGRVARLRDIQEMFMGVGLGPDSYAIIEQGRIGQILSTKPHERRAIIEEAAGGSQAGILEGQPQSRQRYRRGSGQAAGFAEAAGGQGAALFGDSRPDARDRAADAGRQGARTGRRGRAHRQAARRTVSGRNAACPEHPGTRKRTRSTEPADLRTGCGDPAKPESSEPD